MMTVESNYKPIANGVLPIDTWSPTNGTQAFEYIDISSVDRVAKCIANTTKVSAEDAPSRARQIVRTGDVLVSTVRPNLNAVALVPSTLDQAIASTGYTVLRCHPKKLDNRYLFYWVQSPAFIDSMVRQATGASYPAVSDRIVKSSEIPLPPLPEQRRIANILDKADAIRRKRREASEQLSSLLQATFLEMFGDPIANPKHWSMSSFGEQVSLLEYGPRFYNEPYSPDGVRIVRITDLDLFGRLDFSAMPRMVVDDDVREKRRLVVGDIILARSGATVGKSALIEKGDPECIAGAYFIRLQFKPAVRPLFAKMVIDSKSIQQIIAKKSQQSAQQNFSGPGIRSLPLPLPPESLQKNFEQLWMRLKRSQKRNATLQRSCDDLFSTVVQRAFKGDL